MTAPTDPTTFDLRDWYRLAAGSFRSMLRVGFSAAGVALLGLALASLLLEVGFVEGGPDLTMMEALGSIAVVGAIGGAILGLGAEASFGASALEAEQDPWRRTAGRVGAGLAVSLTLVLVGTLLPLPEGLPAAIPYARSTVRAAGVAGLICSCVVPPIIGWVSVRFETWKTRWDPYLLFGAWIILIMVLLPTPG